LAERAGKVFPHQANLLLALYNRHPKLALACDQEVAVYVADVFTDAGEDGHLFRREDLVERRQHVAGAAVAAEAFHDARIGRHFAAHFAIRRAAAAPGDSAGYSPQDLHPAVPDDGTAILAHGLGFHNDIALSAPLVDFHI